MERSLNDSSGVYTLETTPLSFPLNIVIASGKGGTGKTMVATNLASMLAQNGEQTAYIDCDVEEPNGHLFLHPDIDRSIPATISVPFIDESKCIACGECVRICQYNALARLGKMVMVFPELCHGCGGCILLCPQHAIAEKEREIGIVETGHAGSIYFTHGRLTIGETLSPPLIRKVLRREPQNIITIIDAPPGTSCPVVSTLHGADFALLVTDPTPFGLNDLGLAVDMVQKLGIPAGVVINRAETANSDAEHFCAARNIPILGHISDSRRIAEAYSRGEIVITCIEGLHDCFTSLWKMLQQQVKR